MEGRPNNKIDQHSKKYTQRKKLVYPPSPTPKPGLFNTPHSPILGL